MNKQGKTTEKRKINCFINSRPRHRWRVIGQ